MTEINAMAEALLASFLDSSIIKQFKSRGVIGIRLVKTAPLKGHLLPVDVSKILWGGSDEWMFIIELEKNDPLEDWLLGVGHEFCHVLFHYFPPLSSHLAHVFQRDYGWHLHPWDAEEIFCDIFSRNWLIRCDNFCELTQLLKSQAFQKKGELFF